LLFPSILCFLKCILIVQGGFALAFPTCIYCAVIKLTAYCLLYFLCNPAPPTAYSAICYIIFIYIIWILL
jgi:hypothetical protein